MSRFPNFMIIGAGKCGTTSLQNYLKQHPQIFLPPKKETFFFLDESERKRQKRWGAVTTESEYLELFAAAPKESSIGEISTIYYTSPQSAELIYAAIPDVKIIAILRNPCDRAFSAYQMFVRAGHEKKSFAELIGDREVKYIKRGFYYSELKPFYQVFPVHNIKILLYDDLVKDPHQFMQELFNFIGVNANFVPNMSKKGRAGGLPKNQTLNRLLTKSNPVRSLIGAMLKLFLPLETRQKIRSALVKKNIAKVKLDPESRQKLIELYRDDIINLQKLIDRDLSAWLLPK